MKRTPQQFVAFDVETTGLHPWHGDRIFAYSLTDWDGTTDVYRFDNRSDRLNRKALRTLKEFFQDTSIVKIAHNHKFDFSHVLAFGVEVPEETIWHDTMILSQILQNKCPSHAQDYLAELICGYPGDIDQETKKQAKQKANSLNRANPNKPSRDYAYELVDKDLMHRYQVADGERCMLLYRAFIDKILVDDLIYADYRNEIDLVKTTIAMERSGLNINITKTEKIVAICSDTANKAQKELNKLVGYEINVNSSTQLAALLYSQMGFTCTRFTKKMNQACDKVALEELDAKHKCPELDLILKIRAYERGATTCAKYITLADSKGLIHPNIKTNEATTGRQSCADPNLQNIANPDNGNVRYVIPARECFVAPKDYVLLLVDYSGIELRLIVDACGEQEMIDTLNTGGDIHGLGAETIYERSDYSYAERAGCKTLGFSYPYGGSDEAAAKDLVNIDKTQIPAALRRYKKRFPKLVRFNATVLGEARDNGYITTAFGRKITVTSGKAYTGANYKIQGTAAGILKRAQNRLHEYCRTNFEPGLLQPVVPVHDEIVMKMHRSLLVDKDRILTEMSELMCYHPEISVRLDVEWDMSTTSWAKKKELKELNKKLAKMER